MAVSSTIKDAIRVFLRSLHRRLALHDVQLGHLTFLRIVRRQEGLTQRELSERTGLMDPANVIA